MPSAPPDSVATSAPVLSVRLGESLEAVAAASTQRFDFAKGLEDTWLQAVEGETALRLRGPQGALDFPPGRLITVHTVAAHVEQVDAVVTLEPLGFDAVFDLAAKLGEQIDAAKWPRSEDPMLSAAEIKQQFRDPKGSDNLKRYTASWQNADGDVLRLQVSRLRRGTKPGLFSRGNTDEFLLVAEASNLAKYRVLVERMTQLRQQDGVPTQSLSRPIQLRPYLEAYRASFPETPAPGQ